MIYFSICEGKGSFPKSQIKSMEVDDYFCDTELQNYNKTGLKRTINPFIFQNNFQFLLVHFLYFENKF